LPKVVVDEANDQILTSLDLVFQHRELLDDLDSAVFGDFLADPLRILYKYFDYVVVFHIMEKTQANSDRKDTSIRCRLEWINIVLVAMDLPEYSEFYKGWERGSNEW